MSDERALHEQNPTSRFSDRAADYVKYRPTYPREAIDFVLAGLEAARIVAADVGAGTGISTRLLAERGVRVIAIEPNDAMRAAAEPHANVEWRAGTAEATGLADASVDLVLCAQAFHWFREVEALDEFARVLRPRGRVALVWNNRDFEDPFTAGYREVVLAASGNHPAEAREFDAGLIQRHRKFGAFRKFETPSEQVLDAAGLLGRATSASYVPKEGALFEELKRGLTALHGRFADGEGLVRLRYQTKVYVAERA